MRYTKRNFKYDEGSPMERLQELENKLDDGTLLEPPCKVGDTAYAVCEDLNVDGVFTIESYTVTGICYELDDSENEKKWYIEDSSGALWDVGSEWAILDRAEAERVKAEKECAAI